VLGRGYRFAVVPGGVNTEQLDDPVVGTILAGYRVDGIAGKGGMGVVYRATDLTLDRPVAIKLVAPALAEDPLFRQRFETESRLAASLDHPNVVPIYHAGEESGVLFQVMRYVAGSDLRTVIARDGPIEPDRAVTIAQQVAAALDAAHAAGLVHRDVKPANVLLAEGDHAYLTDFGLSKRIAAPDSPTETGGILGTVNYIAPEQIRNQAVDGRTDLYALGCVVFHMLTRSVPFPLDSEEATLWAHLSTAPPAVSDRNPGLPVGLDAVIARALSKAPADRHASAGEFAAALAEAVRAKAGPAELRPEAHVPLQGPLVVGSGIRLVDRVQETARIKRLAAEAENSVNRLVLIAGEAGIGKTRLATELASTLFASGWTVLYGRAATESVVPYEPFVEAIRHYLTHNPLPAGAIETAMLPELAELSRIMPELRMSGAARAFPEDDAHLQRYRMFEGVVALLAWMLADRPVCLVLDDLHWADHATVLLLRHVLRSTETARLMVVATCREPDIAPESGLEELLGELRRDQRLERVPLVGMDPGDTASLVGEVAGEQPSEQFAALLQEKTGGNPFFIEEVMRGLSERGDHGDFDRAALERMGVPEGVKELISSRLRHADPMAADTLAAAAVLGQSFDPAILSRLLERSLEGVLGALEAGVAAGLVVDQPGEREFAFRHALVREALHETFSASRRALLHLRAGEALEAEGAAAAELALHFWEARHIGGAPKAVTYSIRAAERAAHARADHEAVFHYQRALEASELTKENDRELVCRVTLGLGEAQMRAGDPAAGRPTLVRAAELAQELDLPDVLASAALNAGAFSLSAGGLDELLVDLLERALERVPPGATRARLMARLGTALYWSDQVERRERLAAEAEQMARAEDDPATLATVLGYNLVTLWSPEGADRAVEEATEVLRLSEAAGEQEMALRARSSRINHLLMVGRVEPAFEDIDRFGDLARLLRQPRVLWYAPLFEAMRALTVGRFAEAERLCMQSAQIGREVDPSLSSLLSGAQLLYLRWWQGRLEELAPAVEGFAANYPAMPAWRCALALIRRELEDRPGASEVVSGVRAEGFDKLPHDNIWLVALTFLVEACGWLRDREAAAELEPLLRPFSGLIAVSPNAGCLAPVDRLLALLVGAQGRDEEAAGLLERAIDQCAEMGARPLLAMAQIDYAELCEDRSRAREALATAEELGMARVVARAERILVQ
jgi:tetratricopeptide (TPR) repeat protein